MPTTSDNQSSQLDNERVESEDILQATVPLELTGQRLDQAAVALFPDYSRARLQTWIREGHLLADGQKLAPKHKLVGGESLSLTVITEPQGEWVAEPMELEIVHEDEHLLVLNKPAGMVVHPAAGNPSGTLLNGLLHHCQVLENLPRGGIVHRLDKDTTGLMVVAKTLASHTHLVAQLQARSVKREYVALVYGHPNAEGRVEASIGRHPRQRQKMAVLPHGGKEALTHFQVLEYHPHCSYLALQLSTGRTHQIRVHMTHLGFPLLGDPTYGSNRIHKVLSGLLTEKGFQRQALHARKLALVHPGSGELCEWQAPLPGDLQQLLDAVRALPQ